MTTDLTNGTKIIRVEVARMAPNPTVPQIVNVPVNYADKLKKFSDLNFKCGSRRCYFI